MTNVEKALMPPAIAILQADDLSFRHATPRSPLLFDRLSIAVRPGVTWVCGDEGTGKSTLLRLLASALPASGNLYLNGVSLAHDPAGYQRQVAWMDPRDTALDRQTARQIFADLPHQHPDCDRQALQTHLGGLSLAPHLDKTLQMMSTGTRRKVFLAAALAAVAPVTLLDQPFMALDRPSIDYLLKLLSEAAAHPHRAWLVADYEAPIGVALAGIVKLGK